MPHLIILVCCLNETNCSLKQILTCWKRFTDTSLVVQGNFTARSLVKFTVQMKSVKSTIHTLDASLCSTCNDVNLIFFTKSISKSQSKLQSIENTKDTGWCYYDLITNEPLKRKLRLLEKQKEIPYSFMDQEWSNYI